MGEGEETETREGKGTKRKGRDGRKVRDRERGPRALPLLYASPSPSPSLSHLPVVPHLPSSFTYHSPNRKYLFPDKDIPWARTKKFGFAGAHKFGNRSILPTYSLVMLELKK
jgi:hypothetical protein